MTSEPIEKLIEKRRKKYDTTKNIYYPFLKGIVYFNNKGFRHATHDGRNRIRNKADAEMRLNLLLHINTVIQKATKYNRPPMLVPKNSQNNKAGKELTYYELYCALGRAKNKRKVGIIVVLRKIGNGRLHYYSVRYATNKQNRP